MGAHFRGQRFDFVEDWANGLAMLRELFDADIVGVLQQFILLFAGRSMNNAEGVRKIHARQGADRRYRIGACEAAELEIDGCNVGSPKSVFEFLVRGVDQFVPFTWSQLRGELSEKVRARSEDSQRQRPGHLRD